MNMAYDPLGPSARRHRQRQRLGPDARCIGCGASDPTVLIQVRRKSFEFHHPLGEAHVPDLTVIVCRNCHAIFSARQVDDGVPLTSQSTVLERILAAFEALISFLPALAENLTELVDRGRAFLAGLDRAYPEWRNQPWAK